MDSTSDADREYASIQEFFGSGLRVRCLQIFHLAMTGQLFHVTLTVGRSLIRVQIRPDFVNTMADAPDPDALPRLLREIPLRDDTTLDLLQIKAIYPVPFR
jgi:hypothetical protein